MAKLNYSKPMLSICPIPLEEGNVVNGCAQKSTSGEYVCPVKNYFDEYVFLKSISGCTEKSQSDDPTVCYYVPDGSITVFGS